MINAFLLFMKKFKMTTKNGGKTIFWEKIARRLRIYPRDCAEISLSCNVFEINVFLCLFKNSRRLSKMAENDFWEKFQFTLQIPRRSEIALSHTISEINP